MPYYDSAASDALHALQKAATSGCLGSHREWVGNGVLREKLGKWVEQDFLKNKFGLRFAGV